MRCNQSEIVEDILQHLRQRGGENSEWCVGTARDSHQPFFQQHAAADAGDGLVEPIGPIRPTWLIWREAYTTYAAAEVVDRLKGCGLRPDRDSIPGDIVFVYHPAPHA